MKKIYFSVLSIVSALGINAQTLTQANHAPANNDMYSTYQCDSTGVSPGASGAGASWNFASIATHSSVVNNYTASSVSNSNYPSADIAVASSTSNLSYYKSTASDFKYWGGNLLIGGIGATITYTAPAVYAAYPMSLSTSTSAVTGGSLVALGNNGTFTGNSNVVYDGTGTLMLPGGNTYTNALRVVTSQTINFNAGFVTGVVTQVNYDYYVPGTKAPMFTISTSSLSSNLGAPSSQTVVTRYKTTSVGVEKNNKDLSEIKVYPSPASSQLTISSANTGAAQITIFDLSGRIVEQALLNNSASTINVSNYANGLYNYIILGKDKEVLKASKFTVSH